MKGLLPGIRIVDRPDGGGPPRCRLSAGTVLAEGLGQGGLRFESDAYVPREPWREPDAEERRLIYSREAPGDIGSWVDVVRLPMRILEEFGPLRELAGDVFRPDVVDEQRRSPKTRRGIERVLEYLGRFAETEGRSFEGAGISIKAPGLRTATIDDRTGRYTGLHLDSWYMRPLRDRATSPNRICINIGLDDRYLLWINLPLQTMADLLGMPVPDDPSQPEVGLGAGGDFMARFPSYPVIKLRVAPGEGYIAPTENMIHDGSTEGAHSLDITLTIRGHFRCGADLA